MSKVTFGLDSQRLTTHAVQRLFFGPPQSFHAEVAECHKKFEMNDELRKSVYGT
mgnify:CR=1 FL=1